MRKPHVSAPQLYDPGPPLAREPDREASVFGLSFGGWHRIAYADWGPLGDRTPVICVPGLSRQGRDFDFLAEELSRQGRRTVCPDLPGRGRSGRLANALLYVFPQYCADLTTMTYATGAQKVDWVGTSLGGLIGIVLASMPGNRIRRLVVNDIGPSVPHQAEVRIGERLDRMPQRFKTFGDAIAFFRDAFSDYGAMDDIRWHHIVRHSIEWSERDGIFNLLYDRSITTAYHLYRYYSASLWAFWRNIQVPVLIVVGEKSNVLPLELVQEMQRQNPRARCLKVPDVGHMPMLMQSDQVDPVVQFLMEE
jgi:pimeloyl-ACP methyl ester carboxylesterase